jgi:cytochrome c-type biogenesis protein
MIEVPFVIGAFVAGVLMFLAPCTLPMVPAYLAFIAGGKRDRIFKNALAFVLGFSLIFIILGIFAGAIGDLLGPWRAHLGKIAGLILVLFGISMLELFKIPFMSSDQRIALPKWLSIGNTQSSFLIGTLFAIGWSPCIGPILGTILLLASINATALKGALLLAVFSLGFGLPFLLSALALERAQSLFSWSGSLSKALSILGGIILIILGVLMITGNIGLLVSFGYMFFSSLGYERLLNYL